MYAWQFARALYLADRNGWTRFVSIQPHYNPLYREEEREKLGLCRAEGSHSTESARSGDARSSLGGRTHVDFFC